MSWSLFAIPRHVIAAGDPDWLAAAGQLPAEPDEPRPLPTVADVVAAMHASGTHTCGQLVVTGLDIPLCTHALCDRSRDLGEMNVHVSHEPLRNTYAPGERTECLSFRKPWARAVLALLCELGAAGPWIVFHDSDLSELVTIRPGDTPGSVDWPWGPQEEAPAHGVPQTGAS